MMLPGRTVWKWVALSLLLHLAILAPWRGGRPGRPSAVPTVLHVSILTAPGPLPAGPAATSRPAPARHVAPALLRAAPLQRPAAAIARRPRPAARHLPGAVRALTARARQRMATGPTTAPPAARPTTDATPVAMPDNGRALPPAAVTTAAPRPDSPGLSPAAGAAAAGHATENLPARVLASRPPAYPAIARENGWEGIARLRVRLDAAGRPQAVRLLQSSRYAVLDQRAIAAAKRWQYAPAMRGGQPIPSSLDLSVRFRLADSE